MTDQHDEYDEVRHLLGDARHDEPIPTDVADRLDRVLAQLAAGEPVPADGGSAERAPVVDLATQRRRARGRNLLIAAAAVVAVGVGFNQLDLSMSSSSDQAASSADEGSPDAALDGGSDLDSVDEPSPAEELEGLREGTGRDRSSSQLIRSRLVLTDADFASVASRKALKSRALSAAVPTSGSDALDPEEQRSSPDAPPDGGSLVAGGDAQAYFYGATVCGPGPYGDGSLFLVTYRRHPAVLAVRPREGDSTVVDLLRCRSGEVLRSSTVPTPRDR